MKIIKLFLISYFCLFTFSSKLVADDFDFEQLFSQFMQNMNNDTNNLTDDDDLDLENSKNYENNKNFEVVQKQSDFVFKKFEDHLSKYFPKVFLMRERFLENMTPKDIAAALQQIVDMLHDKSWLYVEYIFRPLDKILKKNNLKEEWKKDGYNNQFLIDFFKDKEIKKWLKSGGGYYEYIADQLSFYCEFIDKARIDKETGRVFLEKDFWQDLELFYRPSTQKQKVKSEKLKDNWVKNGITVHEQLYVFTFDYFAKLFLEGILNKDLTMSNRFFNDLRKLISDCSGSCYEAKYKEYLKTYKELLEKLKQKGSDVFLTDSRNGREHELQF